MLGVRSKQVRAIMQLSPEERAALTTKRRIDGIARFSNEVVDDIVDKVGATRLWAASRPGHHAEVEAQRKRQAYAVAAE